MFALYTCHVCGLEVNTKASNTLKLVTAWVKGPSFRQVSRLEREEHKYVHDFCLVNNDVFDTLF